MTKNYNNKIVRRHIKACKKQIAEIEMRKTEIEKVLLFMREQPPRSYFILTIKRLLIRLEKYNQMHIKWARRIEVRTPKKAHKKENTLGQVNDRA
jgi:hypothetical protein